MSSPMSLKQDASTLNKGASTSLKRLGVRDEKAKPNGNDLRSHRYGKPANITRLLMKREMFSDERMETSVMDKAFLPKLKMKTEYLTPRITSDELNSVFGLEYSSDGKILLSCHSDGSLRAFDDRTHQVIWTNERAHDDCCNGATFVDSTSFASYSDDNSVKLWDIRNKSIALKVLTGHTDWIKNVNITPGGGKLLSSGLDGTIRMFDLKSPLTKMESDPILYFPFLYRVKLSKGGDFLVFSTKYTSAYKINNLDLDQLWTDVASFTMNQHSTHAFSKDRNRIELVHFVPGHHSHSKGYSLSLHPHDECCVIRHSRTAMRFEVSTESGIELPDLPSSEWIAVYTIENFQSRKQMTIRPLTSRWHVSNLPNPNSLVFDFNVWQQYNVGRRLDSCIQRNANTIRRRLNMVFRGWIEDEFTSTCKPQDINDATYFREFTENAHGIIKETDINSTGNLICSPNAEGFQIFSYDSQMNSYKESLHKDGKNTDDMIAKQLVLVKDCSLGKGSPCCYCVKFSPIGNGVVAGGGGGKVVWFRPLDSNCDRL